MSIEKTFFANNNYFLLLEIIYDHFSKEHDYEISENEEKLTLEVMTHVFNNSSKKPVGMKNSMFIKSLNKKSLNQVIKMITKKLQQSSQLSPSQSESRKQELHITSRPNSYNNSSSDRIVGVENTRGSNIDVSDKFSKMNEMRNSENTQAPRVKPNFQDNVKEDNTAVMSLYEKEMKKREEDLKKQEQKEKNEEINEQIFQDTKTNILGVQTNVIPPSEGGTFPGINNSIDGVGVQSFGSDIITSANPLRDMSEKAVGKMVQRTEEELNQAYVLPKSASANDVLIPQPKMYNEIFKHYHSNYTKIYYFSVDSRDRNQDDYPSASTYQVEFDTVYKDILDIELISAEIPKTSFLINSSNNLIYFQETTTQESGGTFFTATIPVGNYTAVELATAIKTAMDAEGSNTYTVTVDETLTNKFTISSDTTNIDPDLFNLLFDGGSEKFGSSTRKVYRTNSIGPVIGFNRTDLSTLAAYTGQNQFNLEGENYVYLYIKELENLESPTGGDTAHDSFTKITLDTSSSNANIKFYKSEHDYISKVYFVPPLAKLGQMIIRFNTYNGDLYDFNGREHSLFFKITTFRQSSNYYGQSDNFPGN